MCEIPTAYYITVYNENLSSKCFLSDTKLKNCYFAGTVLSFNISVFIGL